MIAKYRRIMVKKLLFLSLIFLISCPFYGQENGIDQEQDTLKVGLAGSAPFVLDEGEDVGFSGIAVDLWEEMASRKGWKYNYKKFETVGDGLEALESGAIDLLAGPVSITADRLEEFSFSQPYFQSSLSIVSHEEQGLWAYIKPLFSPKLLFAVAAFLFMLAIVGTLFWVAERKKNPEEFSPDPVKGIGSGMWLAVVTMSTVGYGDLAPRSAFGRILAGIWIIITIIFATSMIAGIASVLTMWGNTTGITKIEELAGKKAATISGSSAEAFIRQHHAKLVTVTTLEEAMEKLKAHEVDAIVYDRPELQYYIWENDSEGFNLSHAEYYKQGYGYAFRLSSKLVFEVNLKLLKLAEEQRVQAIITNYLGVTEGEDGFFE